MTRLPRLAAALALGVAVTVVLAGCVSNTPKAGGSDAITVTSTATACDVSRATAASGTISFAITNAGTSVTEFYLLADDGLRIVGEVENIGPGISRTLVVQAKAGTYFTICKPGMSGEGIGKATFTVSGSGTTLGAIDSTAAEDAAAAAYVAYVRSQTEGLVTGTAKFLAAYRAGDTAEARRLYPITRAIYERIEPVAESFGELDPKLDFREADVPTGTEWTGWHRIEKDLWPPAKSDNGGATYVALTAAERTRFADLLQKDTAALNTAVHATTYSVTIDAVSNGAIGLMDEVASGKITGEEEIWSHTDLWDFQANLQGAKVAYEGVRDIVETTDPALVKQLDARFVALQLQLKAYGSLEKGFRSYDSLSTGEVRALSDGVNALAEPLSKLTAALVSPTSPTP